MMMPSNVVCRAVKCYNYLRHLECCFSLILVSSELGPEISRVKEMILSTAGMRRIKMPQLPGEEKVITVFK